MNCANHPDRERIAFCQNCGKPLCQECTRTVGSAVFCEPCLVAKLAGAEASSAAGGPAPGVNYPVEGAIPPLPPSDEPNPALAALLGFIPGVGAMYNGQYAKGIVHLIVFAILVSLAGENGIFGIFIAGWVFYQVLEAHHTAQARRDGTPLPNPFGLNDLGERLGFGKAWPTGTSGRPYGQGVPPAADATTPPAAAYPPPPPGYPPYPPPPPAPNWSTSWENYVPPTAAPFTNPIPPADLNSSYSGNRFPTGAIWLIALGVIFLIGNSRIIHGYPMHLFVPLILIGFGVWQFVHKMTETGPLAD
ncbi:MAG: B-box zinc finger protein, partial [Edaphobacter sp.]